MQIDSTEPGIPTMERRFFITGRRAGNRETGPMRPPARRKATEGNGEQREATGSTGRHRKAPEGTGKQREATGGNGRQREATGGNGRHREATGSTGTKKAAPLVERGPRLAIERG